MTELYAMAVNDFDAKNSLYCKCVLFLTKLVLSGPCCCKYVSHKYQPEVEVTLYFLFAGRTSSDDPQVSDNVVVVCSNEQ